VEKSHNSDTASKHLKGLPQRRGTSKGGSFYRDPSFFVSSASMRANIPP
jgi:hypothetical protein